MSLKKSMPTYSAILVSLMLTACAPLPKPPESAPSQAMPPLEWPQGLQYQIDPTRSEFRVRLSAEGPLARFGHPHVIGSTGIHGQVVVPDDWTQTAFELGFDVDDLVVDPPLWRQQAGLEPEIPQEDIEGTLANLRSEAQLNADLFPRIELQSEAITGPRHQPTLTVWVSVAGHLSQQTLPIALHWGEDELIASASTTWRLTELGITPFSVFGGGLRVGDEIELKLRLYAVLGSDQSMPD